MRYDADHKQKTRERVLKAAATAIRSEGPHRVGVAPLMAKAGLTHGGFYAHFASKDALIAEAIGVMSGQAAARFARETDGLHGAEGLSAYLDFYLSPQHRDSREAGCLLPALSGDAPRLEPASREQFGAAVAGLAARIEGLLVEMAAPGAADLARSIVAEAVGAVALARAVADPVQSDAILDSSLAALKRRAGLVAEA